VERWPNLFIVGAPKAGSTSFYNYLKEIPGIYMSPIKETDYFSINLYPKNDHSRQIRDKKQYLGLFEKVKDEKIVGEASVSYLSNPEAPKLIHQVVPSARIIISLRDPIDRVFSHYLMQVRYGRLKTSFHEQLQIELKHRTSYIEPGMKPEVGLYFQNVKRYLDIFSRDQVKIIIFEDLIKNTKGIVEEILRFLGINYSLNDFEGLVENPFVVPRTQAAKYILGSITARKIAKQIIPKSTRRFLGQKVLATKQPKPKMDDDDKETLIKFYQDDAQKLQTLIERKLEWPNFFDTNT